MRPSSWLAAVAGALVLTGAGGVASVAFGFSLSPLAVSWLLALGAGLGFAVAEGTGALVWVRDSAASREEQYARADLLRADADVRRAAVAPVAEPEQPAADYSIDPMVRSHRWRVMAHRFLVDADRHGFPIRIMVERGVVSWEGWGQMTAALTAAGVLVKSPRAGWASGWDILRWEAESRALPWPDSDPPDVHIGATNNATTANNTRPEVVEGVRAD